MAGKFNTKFYSDYIFHQQYKSNANIELTYRCPLQCHQCFRSHITGPDSIKKTWVKERIAESHDISLDDFRKICNFFKDNISLCGQLADSVYHPKFFDILKILRDEYPDCRYKIHTAAHQRNIEWYKKAFELCTNKTTWVFGLDGLPDVSFLYRKNQNSQLIYDAMMLAREMDIKVHWQMIVFDFNEHQIEEVKSICKDKGMELQLVISNRLSNSNNKPSPEYYTEGPVSKEIRFK